MDYRQGAGNSPVESFAPHSPHLLECAGLTPFGVNARKSMYGKGLRNRGTDYGVVQGLPAYPHYWPRQSNPKRKRGRNPLCSPRLRLGLRMGGNPRPVYSGNSESTSRNRPNTRDFAL